MGKTKQAKEKRFDRNVEISAPILDPEIVKAIHTPPKGQGFDIKHAGFKALLSDLNSQDSTDELQPLNENHVPSYLGISCAVSGYSNYSPYVRKVDSQSASTNQLQTDEGPKLLTPNRSRATSPLGEIQSKFQVHHIKIDKSHIHSADEERKELTELITASASDHRRSPSPNFPPTENDRHHGAYVGARYFPMPPPSGVVNKHIPLLGIDDDQDPSTFDETNKVEEKIADLYGEGFVDNWRETQSHKQKRELSSEEAANQKQASKNPKDLVNLKPIPAQSKKVDEQQTIDVPTPNIKVLEGVEKQFLNKLLTDENPPVPIPSPDRMVVSSPTLRSRKDHIEEFTPEPVTEDQIKIASPTLSPVRDQEVDILSLDKNLNASIESSTADKVISDDIIDLGDKVAFTRDDIIQLASESPVAESRNDIIRFSPEPLVESQLVAISPEPQVATPESPRAHIASPPMSPDSGKSQSIGGEDESVMSSASRVNRDEQIEYEIKADSPVPNQSSPVRILSKFDQVENPDQLVEFNETKTLVSTSSNINPGGNPATTSIEQPSQIDKAEPITSDVGEQLTKDGLYYLQELAQVESSIMADIAATEAVLEAQESQIDEDTIGIIRSAIGKASLLLNKKCNQFRSLCQANIDKRADDQFATLNEDLAGFWDMVMIQVEDVRRSFAELSEARERNWAPVEGKEEPRKQNSDGSPNSSHGGPKPKLSAQKDQKRRERLMEHINQAKQQVEKDATGDAFDNIKIATAPTLARSDDESVQDRQQQQEAIMVDLLDFEKDTKYDA